MSTLKDAPRVNPEQLAVAGPDGGEHSNLGIDELAQENLKELAPHASLVDAVLARKLDAQRLAQLRGCREDALDAANRVDDDVVASDFEYKVRIRSTPDLLREGEGVGSGGGEGEGRWRPGRTTSAKMPRGARTRRRTPPPHAAAARRRRTPPRT